MGRKRKVVTQDDGTPVEVETAEDDAAESAETEAEVSAVFEDPAPAPVSRGYGHDAPVEVVWTELGEQDGVMSEHGLHKAGDVVSTRHSATLIAHGYAVEK